MRLNCDARRDVAPEALAKFVDSGLDYAKRHAEIIERFGHFPHRIAIVDLPTTQEP